MNKMTYREALQLACNSFFLMSGGNYLRDREAHLALESMLEDIELEPYLDRIPGPVGDLEVSNKEGA